MLTQRTLNGKTAGGLLKQATIEKSGAGAWHVWVGDYQTLQTEHGHMCLERLGGEPVFLRMSDRARRKFEGMLEEAERRMLAKA